MTTRSVFLLSDAKTKLSIARTERRDQCRHVSIPLHTTEALHGFEDPGSDPRII
jgi:hypothetical protein